MAGPPQNGNSTALVDALIARNLASQGAQPGQQQLEGTTLPNPDPNSSPPVYGELPGEGYLFAHDPATRQAAVISTTPEFVRMTILRAMEVAATNAQLPYAEVDVSKQAEALLRMAQAYLLIDPAVDSEGVPVAGKAMAQAAQGILTAQAAPQPVSSGGEAHGTIKKKPGQPPRVLPGAAAQNLSNMHEHLEELIQGDRGSRPLPRPRIGQ